MGSAASVDGKSVRKSSPDDTRSRSTRASSCKSLVSHVDAFVAYDMLEDEEFSKSLIEFLRERGLTVQAQEYNVISPKHNVASDHASCCVLLLHVKSFKAMLSNRASLLYHIMLTHSRSSLIPVLFDDSTCDYGQNAYKKYFRSNSFIYFTHDSSSIRHEIYNKVYQVISKPALESLRNSSYNDLSSIASSVPSVHDVEDIIIPPKYYEDTGSPKDASTLYNIANSFTLAGDFPHAVHYYQLAAKQAHMEAKYELALCYIHGKGVAIDDAEAVVLLEQCVESGMIKANVVLGECYLRSSTAPHNPSRAFQLFEDAATSASTPTSTIASFHVGMCYASGEGVVQNNAKAMHWLEIAAEKEFAEAEYQLGKAYFQGSLTGKSLPDAIRWYTRSASHGHASAAFDLAKHYLELETVTESENAVIWLLKAYNLGRNDASYYLGKCYWDGTHVTRNAEEAAKWFRLAANHGFPDAQYCLATCYADGIGTPRHEQMAMDWCRLAAEKGHAGAQYFVGNCYMEGIGTLQDEREAVKWYKLAAEQNHAEALFALGECYRYGMGVQRQFSEAEHYLLEAAKQEHMDAQYNLGELYLTDDSIYPNLSWALPYITSAAEKGHVLAQHALGELYMHGHDGLPADLELGLQWHTRAAAKGSCESQCLLGHCYLNGIYGVKIDYAKAVLMLESAADQGHVQAQYELATCYLDGKGVSKDEYAAAEWFELAADKGHIDAQYSIGTCYMNGTGVRKSERAALKWFRSAASQGHEGANLVLQDRILSSTSNSPTMPQQFF